MSYNPRGKRFKIDIRNPLRSALCDKTQLNMRHCDLVKQYEYYGDTLTWTGYMVGKWYVDKPNPSLRPVKLKPDPVPLTNPRPPQINPNAPTSQDNYFLLNNIYFGG